MKKIYVFILTLFLAITYLGCDTNSSNLTNENKSNLDTDTQTYQSTVPHPVPNSYDSEFPPASPPEI